MKSNRNLLSTRGLCYIGIFVAVVAVCAQIQIPQPGGVPFTLQAWAIAFSGLILGPKNAVIVAVVYGLLGAFGAPVFAGFRGGLDVIAGRTGGFIFSFPILALLAGLGARKEGFVWSFICLALGNAINLVSGMLYFSWVTSLTIPVSFGFTVAPFIIVTVIMIAVLPFMSKSIRYAMKRAGVSA